MSENDEEIWKSIPGYEDLYEISNYGRIISHRKAKPGGGYYIDNNYRKIMKNFVDCTKHESIILCDHNSNSCRKIIGRLVLETFQGPPPHKSYDADHIDNNPSNNHITNLQWITHLENIRRKEIFGTVLRGSKHNMAKLTEEDVLLIRKMYKSGIYTQTELAPMFGVDKVRIHYIVKRKDWKHI